MVYGRGDVPAWIIALPDVARVVDHAIDDPPRAVNREIAITPRATP
jgi:hypothetical protein